MIKTENMIIWGRDFELNIVFDCYAGEDITEEQEKALQTFLHHNEWIDKAKEKVEKYCKKDVLADKENEKKDNIFSYIKPKSIYVDRNPKGVRVAILCHYRYDPEHGVAVIFSPKGDVTIGHEDDII